MAEPTTQDLLLSALKSAPPHIQTFIASGKFDTFMATLQGNLNLHVDVADKVSNELLMMLLGLATPTELPGNLRSEAGLSEDLIRRVVDATNKEIFAPLQSETLAAGRAVAPSAPSAAKAAAPAVDLAGRPVPAPAAPIMVPSPPTPVPPPPAYMPPAPTPIARPAQDVPAMRTMQHDVETMKEGGGVPEPVPYRAPAPVSAPVPAPAPMPAPTPAPFVPPTLVTPPPPPPRPPQPIAALQQKPVTPNAEALSKTLQKYGIDPYREIPE